LEEIGAEKKEATSYTRAVPHYLRPDIELASGFFCRGVVRAFGCDPPPFPQRRPDVHVSNVDRSHLLGIPVILIKLAFAFCEIYF
jgi:hypothetical protein